MYVCMSSRAHTLKHAHAENISLNFQAQLQPLSDLGLILTVEAVKSQALSQEYKRYIKIAKQIVYGDKPETPV